MEVCDEDGKTYVPAVGITQEDIDELGVEGEPQEGKLAYQELKQLGVYQVKRNSRRQLRLYCFQGLRGRPRG